MKELNKRHNICLEIVTPLSIGPGVEKDWTKGVDYVEKDGKIFLLNLHKMIDAGIDVNKLTTCIEKKDSNNLLKLIGRKLLDVSDKEMELPVTSSQNIKSFVKSQFTGCPIIPGSSIKGAIRSIIFNHLRFNETKEKDVFGNSTKGDEFMRFFKFTDFNFDDTELINTKIYSLINKGDKWSGGWKHSFAEGTNAHFKPTGFNTLYESLMPSQIGYGALMLSETAFDTFGINNQIKGQQKKELFLLSNLFKVINDYTRNYLKKEKDFFLSYPTEKSERIIDGIDELIKQIPTDNSFCIFKMAVGSGFHSITGDWLFDDYVSGILDRKRNKGNNVKPKSRKIAILKDKRFMLMGFVKITPLTCEESDSIALEKEDLFNEKLKESKTKREQIKKESEKRREVELLQRQRQKDLEELLISAHKLYEENNYEEALTLARKANAIKSSNDRTIQQFISEIMLKLNDQKLKKETEILQKRIEEITKIQNSIPLSDRISKANKLPTLFGNIKTWMKQNDRDTLTPEELTSVRDKIVKIYDSMKSKEKTEWKTKIQKWENLSLLIGLDVIEQWINEL